jgi:hypothetical protein
MGTAENAKIQIESVPELVPMAALTDHGDHKDFRGAGEMWSNQAGYIPTVLPNGVLTGGIVSPAVSGSDDVVDVAALTCNLNGVEESIGADADLSIPRPSATHIKYSITVKANKAIEAVAGTESTAFSTVRGSAGGPPFILPDSIEIAQVWLSSDSSAPITAAEIKQAWGTYQERAFYPTWEESHFNVEAGVMGTAGVVFDAALPLTHSAISPEVPQTKGVYAEYYEPTFTDIAKSAEFVPPETTYTTSSKQIYGMTIGASASALNQGSFTAYLNDGIADPLLSLKGKSLFFKFFQNRLSSFPFILVQGIFGITRTFPAADQITAACTISAETAAVEIVA